MSAASCLREARSFSGPSPQVTYRGVPGKFEGIFLRTALSHRPMQRRGFSWRTFFISSATIQSVAVGASIAIFTLLRPMCAMWMEMLFSDENLLAFAAAHHHHDAVSTADARA